MTNMNPNPPQTSFSIQVHPQNPSTATKTSPNYTYPIHIEQTIQHQASVYNSSEFAHGVSHFECNELSIPEHLLASQVKVKTAARCSPISAARLGPNIIIHAHCIIFVLSGE